MTTPAPPAAAETAPADETFTAQLLTALRNGPEVEDAVLEAYERAGTRQAAARGTDTSRRARRAE